MKNSVEMEYRKALKEIGEITPWYSDEYGFYCFSHPAYPVVDYIADTPEETVMGYKRILREWIADRMAGKVPTYIEKMTSGRGGRREGAGRPPGPPTKRISVPEEIADVVNWIKEDPSRATQVRRLMGA